jgi:PTH1 family peptidyl-tRNA hydrolase
LFFPILQGVNLHLIVGLGNPGEKYNKTRHNIGFAFLDHLAEKHGFSFSGPKWQAKNCKTLLWGESLVLAKPETFMNLSGMSVGQMASYYKITPEKIIVIHDELDLPLGRVKMVFDRGPGGHNGIISIIAHLNSKNFARIRIGVGRPNSEKVEMSSFVLSRFEETELQTVEKMYNDIEYALELYVRQGRAVAMNFLNTIK